MFSTTLIALCILAAIIWWWQSNMRAKEIANAAAKELCELHKVQFLDQSVNLVRFRFKRHVDGRMAFIRTYDFDYATGDEIRHRGRIIVHGSQVIEQDLKFVNGLSIENRADLGVKETTNKPGEVIDFKKFQKPANDD